MTSEREYEWGVRFGPDQIWVYRDSEAALSAQKGLLPIPTKIERREVGPWELWEPEKETP